MAERLARKAPGKECCGQASGNSLEALPHGHFAGALQRQPDGIPDMHLFPS